MSSLQIKNLRKSYGAVEVLKDINLEAESGEFVALVGPSGCGKSTLLSIIAGLESVTSGEVLIEDHVVNDAAPKDRDIAMVFQSYALYPTMTVRQNMTFGMECRNIDKATQDETVKRVATLLQIEPLLNRKPGQLSGGQRQRVAMGRALVRDPKLFLFDEPLSNLDAKLRVEMRSEIKKLHQTVGRTTVYVTHDQIEAMTLATRIAVMYQGVLQQYDTPKTIYEKPANTFVAGFMGSPNMNFFKAKAVKNGDGFSVVIEGGEGTPLPLPADRYDTLTDGQSIIFGVRPEHFSPASDNRAERKGIASVAVPVRVDMDEPTGSETVLLTTIAGQNATIVCEPDAAPAIGDTVDFEIDMTKISLFDRKSELRL
ncbi:MULTISPECIES: ABC transporter ATP-binding protein [Halocynthiibacter]|uniref:Sn-glycerol-3-phosphate ABC transporter ATP-binding protein UgpC n=1 Tax=Halocynthiibacter halioticoli TaxID=2986804 RepID=A0AAE3LUP1_9RHOB|nr:MULTISPECIES: sn-glycerol-3-phosphate ABC transporter ATP-binding protein UgpC [Halocynthiibacter]MCV6825075.1 sn-glycerol-3-phosphate ABC transporter ATP-binding protein UgpC [Halocynthiibacter halioticoli]MCW4058076.1 sn-glycerol-3-phosphate ABC transporter ATP-binding protein UgpC [Halocynthiibacter sp. SDUM655004]